MAKETKPCFTCGKSVPKTDQQRINYFKELSQKNGVSYVYFKDAEGRICITKAKNFKPKKGQEYALVSEFGNVPVTDVVETASRGSEPNDVGTDTSEV